MEFKRLSEVETIDEVPEGAHVLGEVDGVVKRMPSKGLGGAVATAIIKMDGYDDMLNGGDRSAAPVQAGSPEVSMTFSCTNMTFEEAYQTLMSGEPLSAVIMKDMDLNIPGIVLAQIVMLLDVDVGVPCIGIIANMELYWTADGISTEAPSGDK